jgi:putative membrane-bound dehydrogenase-like protein
MARPTLRCPFPVPTWAGGLLLLVLAAWPAPADGPGLPPVAADPTALPFRVPDGFVAERIAGPPLVEFPLFASFDDRGRLYVVDSAGVNWLPDQLRKDPPHRIRLLEDTDGDGRFDRTTVFADRLTYPQGVLWYEGAVYCASPPSLWRFEDTQGTGVADRRTELLTGFTFTKWADDLHGPSAGPDGRLYWTSGRYPYQVRRPGGEVLYEGNGPRVLRCRPDGSDVEIYCAGIGNPVIVTFTAEGEPLTNGTFALTGTDGNAFARNKPVPPGNERDALIHCVPGGVYPIKDRNAAEQRGVKQTGDLLPLLYRLDAVAPSGLVRYRGEALGPAYRDNLFAAQFGARTVKRYVLRRDGATFAAEAEDFLTATTEHFHPTDVLEDADGSLLVVDTGNWYNLCPGSHVGKERVHGGIYRVRRAGAAAPADPRGRSLRWDELPVAELVSLLDDGRFAVRDQAVARLGRRGDDAVAALRQALTGHTSARLRRNAIWALARSDRPAARAAVRLALADPDTSVRQTAACAAGLHRDAEALPALVRLLGTDPLSVRREAAAALGRVGKAEAVPALLDGLRTGTDRFLEQALVFALIEIDDPAATRAGLADRSPQVRRGAVIALDQMDRGGLTQEQVLPLLNTSDPALQAAVLNVMAHRPGWSSGITGLVGDWLREKTLTAEREDSLRGALLAFSKEAPIQDLMARTLDDPGTPAAVRLLVLETMARAPLDRFPASWVGPVGRALEHPDGRVVLQALAAVRAGRVAGFADTLRRLAGDRDRGDDVRVAAAQALTDGQATLGPELAAFLVACLDEDKPPLVRLGAATSLGRAAWDEGQLERLTAAVGRAGPLELPRLLPAFAGGTSPAVGKELVAALGRAPGFASLTPDALRTALKSYPADVQSQAAPLLQRLEPDGARQAARLAELAPLVQGGDPAKGRAYFFSKKAVCSACHTIQGQGGHVGPDLSRIATTRTGRELLEAVVFPSASFARGYEPYVVSTADGRVFNGIIARETADALYLVNAERAEIRLPRASIDSLTPGKVSIMPQGLDAQMTREELADLLAFLQSLK